MATTVNSIKALSKDLVRLTKVNARLESNKAAQKQSVFSKIANVGFIKNTKLNDLVPGDEVTDMVRRNISPEFVNEVRDAYATSKKVIADGTKMRNRGITMRFDMGDYGGKRGDIIDGIEAKMVYDNHSRVSKSFDKVIDQVNRNARDNGSYYYGEQTVGEKIKNYYGDAKKGGFRKGVTAVTGGSVIAGTGIGVGVAYHNREKNRR